MRRSVVGHAYTPSAMIAKGRARCQADGSNSSTQIADMDLSHPMAAAPMFLCMWPAPGLDDTQLSKSGLPLELHRAQITDRRVSAFRVVEALDIVKHVCLCFIARPVRF